MDIFVGHAVKDKRTEIEAHTGQPMTAERLLVFRERRNAALVADIQAIPNITSITGNHRVSVSSSYTRRINCSSIALGRIFMIHRPESGRQFGNVGLAFA
jgi:hypothetical protein